MEIVLGIDNVTKTFPGVKALDRVSFTVAGGEVHGLVGENGAGKSTLMGVAAGALMPDIGTVEISGQMVNGDPRRARELGLAIVRQEPSLMTDLSVAENLFLGVPESARPAVSNMYAWAQDLLGSWRSELHIKPDDLISALNPEQRFIVEICKALASRPRVLILDEPTEHLTVDDVERLFERVRGVAAKGTGVVYISHRIREVRRIANRVTVLRDGTAQGTFSTETLNDTQIVELIVGGALSAEYPEKSGALDASRVVLDVTDLSGDGFRNVSLSVRQGEIVGLAGIDANGQREFLRALAGLDGSRGFVTINSRRVHISGPSMAARAGIGYLPGDRHRDGIFAELSVRENFSLRSMVQDTLGGVINPRSERARAKSAVATFAVKTPELETPISSLSGGNQQKLVLSSVLATNPVVLLIDEPTQGVDVGARAEIYRILREIAAAGTAIIIVSSDAAEIAGLSDRVMVFSRGQIAEELSGPEVVENNITKAVLTSTTVRASGRNDISAFWKWASGHSAPIVLIAFAVVALGIYASMVSPFYLTQRNVGGMLALIATLALVSYGQQIVLLIGEIDLSVGPLMALCLVTASFFMTGGASAGMVVLGFVMMFLVAGCVGVVNYGLVSRFALHPMIATLATYIGVQAISLILRPAPAGVIDSWLIKALSVKVGFVPVTFIIAVVIAVALEFTLFRTTRGIAFRGFGSKAEAARVSGIRPGFNRFWAYLLCAFFAGLAAIPMLTQVGIGDAKSGINYTLASIAAVVIGGGSLDGGRGTFVGALLGAMLLNQVNVVSTFLQLNDAWSFYLQGIIVLAGVAVYSKSRQMAVAA
ncbi:ATP-binding cassette domain-containing protein [Pseudaminobacter salicylatoxidans]|uniref:ATP-binding cassette domain-containing protein n=1 Tax=Pseudaminobacter salicylatoxidans TaxID=93369 RepID=UPI00031FB442|nr:ATP-binding cassette domain-containing protein [Pseudaminobacter salicylatoxidans]